MVVSQGAVICHALAGIHELLRRHSSISQGTHSPQSAPECTSAGLVLLNEGGVALGEALQARGRRHTNAVTAP